MIKTIDETIEEIKQRKDEHDENGEMEIVDILAEDRKRLLVRKTSLMNLGGYFRFGVRHEIWSDLEKYEQDIPFEYLNGEQYIYCCGYAGAEESELIEIFKKKSMFAG